MSAIGRSPTLLFPDDPAARAIFDPLGTVLCVDDEAQFTPASAIAAYYGWVYALMDAAITWCASAGVPASTARDSRRSNGREAWAPGSKHWRKYSDGCTAKPGERDELRTAVELVPTGNCLGYNPLIGDPHVKCTRPLESMDALDVQAR